MTNFTLEHKKVWVLGLLFNCPTSTGKGACDSNSMKELSPVEIESKVFDMNEKELEEFIEDHKCCLEDNEF